MFWKHKRGYYGEQLEENILALKNGERSRILRILCVFAEKYEESKLIAARALANELEHFEFDDIIRIDKQMRETTLSNWSIDWSEQNIKTFFTPKMSLTECRAVIIFASFNSNGFIREHAVQLLKDYDNTLPYIMLRQNDWVAQVRNAAVSVFDERLKTLHKGELLAALPYAEKLESGNRHSHDQQINRFFEKLSSAEHQETLIKGLQSNHVRTRRICIRALFETEHPNIPLALKVLAHEPDAFLRSILFRKLCAQVIPLNDTARFLLRDKFAGNRKLALNYLLGRPVDDIKEIAYTFLLDKSATLRASAREILQMDDSNIDFCTFYIEALEGNTATAISGLGEVGDITNAQEVEQYIEDSRIAVVCATMITLMKLNAEKYKKTVLHLMEDRRCGVVATAKQLILKYDIQDYELIQTIFWRTPYETTQIKCAVILFAASKWNRLIYMLEVLSCDNERVKSLAHQAITRWLIEFNRFHAQVNIQQKNMIYKWIAILEEELSDSMRKEIVFVLT